MNELLQQIASGEEIQFDVLAKILRPVFPWIDLLSSTEQEPQWHGEGDVWTHTAMVVREAYRAIDEHDRALSADERLAVVLGAALHDVGKAVTTQRRLIHDRERIIAPRHPDRGRSHVAYALRELELPWEVIEHTMALVGHHHDPAKLVRQDCGIAQYRRLARLVDLELLYILETADLKGRICEDLEDLLETLALFRIQSEAFGLWRNTDPYADWRATIESAVGPGQACEFILGSAMRAHERGAITMVEEEIAKSYGYRDDFSHLIVLCGPSGSGKSTWIAQNVPDYDVVALDELRAELTGDPADQSKNGQVRQLSKERLKESLRAKRNVVWDATNLRRDIRNVPIQLGYDYGAFVELVIFQPTPNEARRANASRARSVPSEVLARQFETAEYPYANEAHATSPSIAPPKK